MKYKNIKIGIFIERPNRFIAKVKLDEEICTVHVKNTGRCRELLTEGSRVYLSEGDNPARKTKYDLIAVEKGTSIVNIDSQAPNAAAFEWVSKSGIFSESAKVHREVTYGNSRFDLFIEDGERKAFIEVKGVTLENAGVAMFPDAPTERGAKHVSELIKCRKAGFEAYILFVIQMKGISLFRPNYTTDPTFCEALKEAEKCGVRILVYDCITDEASMVIDGPVKYEL